MSAEARRPVRGGANARLERITAALDWAPFARLLRGLHAARRGRPAYPALTMFKVFLLQQWYGLSDPAMEEALRERASFRRFAGLAPNAAAPDHSTICRRRKRFAERGLGEALLRELDRQLEAQGRFDGAERVALLDATVIESQASQRRARSAGGSSDPDAAWARGAQGWVRGYKGHSGVDAATGLVRRAIFTPGNVNETAVADALYVGDEAAVYADRAYDAAARRALLAAQGIACCILRRGHKHQPLTDAEQERNRALEQVRRPVERLFATLKRSYGYRRVRYFDLLRNRFEFYCKCIAYNLRKLERLQTPA